MTRLFVMALALILAVPAVSAIAPQPVQAQGNDNDYTPLNSRIRRDRQFPTTPPSIFTRRQLSDAGRARSRNMVDLFANCLWSRSNENGRDFLGRTDLGFNNYEQIGIDRNEIRDHYPIETCLQRVARFNNSGVLLNYTPDSMRRWYIQAAYLDMWQDGPTWLVPGYTVASRALPLSQNNTNVVMLLDFADCVVANDPNAADYFFRTGIDSAEEDVAIQQLVPALSACLPDGQTMSMAPGEVRVLMGEALWHAANNSVPVAAEAALAEQGNP